MIHDDNVSFFQMSPRDDDDAAAKHGVREKTINFNSFLPSFNFQLERTLTSSAMLVCLNFIRDGEHFEMEIYSKRNKSNLV